MKIADMTIKYKKIFDKAVFESFTLNSSKFNELWEDISIDFDTTISGPLYAIYTNHNWSYVYNDKENRFGDITEITAMSQWLKDYSADFKERLLSCEPEGEDEIKDRDLLSNKVHLFEVIINMAIEIQSEYERE